MQFTKMHGLGNDFVVVNGFEEILPEDRLDEIGRTLCDRHFGIGADGLVLVLPSRVANFRMRIINADGSEAEMCGNGIRCFGKYVYDKGMTTSRDITVETVKDIQQLKLSVSEGKVESVRVDMAVPRLRRSQIPMRGDDSPMVVEERIRVDGERHAITAVSMGNPHCVLFVNNVDRAPVERLGPAIEKHSLFPERTNVQFVQVLGKRELKMRTWERGAGLTLACGTGACAVTVAAALTGHCPRKPLTIHLPGGDLQTEWLGNDHVIMSGPATTVFTGEVAI